MDLSVFRLVFTRKLQVYCLCDGRQWIQNLHSVEFGFILSPKYSFICVLILKGLVIGY